MEENKNTTILAEQQNNVLFQDACQIIEQAQESAYRQVNETLIKRNWLLGLRIQHEVLKDKRAEYGEQGVKKLAQSLVERFGKGFQVANLYHFIAFYNYHPDIFYAVSRKSVDGNIENILHALSAKSENIFHALSAKSPIRLSWPHYRIILQENTDRGRVWYEQEAAREMWSTRLGLLR
jgi:hypothetical protein